MNEIAEWCACVCAHANFNLCNAKTGSNGRILSETSKKNYTHFLLNALNCVAHTVCELICAARLWHTSHIRDALAHYETIRMKTGHFGMPKHIQQSHHSGDFCLTNEIVAQFLVNKISLRNRLNIFNQLYSLKMFRLLFRIIILSISIELHTMWAAFECATVINAHAPISIVFWVLFGNYAAVYLSDRCGTVYGTNARCCVLQSQYVNTISPCLRRDSHTAHSMNVKWCMWNYHFCCCRSFGFSFRWESCFSTTHNK